MTAPSNPNVEYTKEVRFAVVMYGGVSLAIYINGVAQELLRLVRATADDGNGKTRLSNDELSGSERVYRKLSYLLAQNDDDQPESDSTAPIPTRFVVDTITGASAGGINGIFLAKALVRGQKIDRLQELWVREGAIEKLLNDRLSKDPPVSYDDPPPALLNAKRMYLELLKALDEMDGRTPAAAKRADDQSAASNPLVDELDLYVTTTDLNGLILPMRLTDEVVYERRHKNVFHFIFPRDDEPDPDVDFMPDSNPFLAYAARCTSSFPFAFEPMTLQDIDAVLDGYGDYKNDKEAHSDGDRWKRFFHDYERASGIKQVPPKSRAFADGGDLDNKPFGYAVDTLTRRHAECPVSRKLIYVEPAPEHPEEETEKQERPNFVENALDALSTLPMYETIREDLNRVNERNRMVLRINRVLDNVDYDAEQAKRPAPNDKAANVLESTKQNQEVLTNYSDDEWSKLYLDDMIKRKGRGYAAYHRLEIGAVTDDLARVVTRGAGLSEDSDFFAIFRSLTRAWRRLRYLDYPSDKAEDGVVSQYPINQFLTSFNLSYPIRRITFLRTRIEFLHTLDAAKLADIYKEKWPAGFVVNEDSVREFRKELRRIYAALKKPHIDLRKAARRLRARPKPNEADPVRAARYKALSELSQAIVKKLSGGVQPNTTLNPAVVLDRFLSGTKKGLLDSAEAESDRRADSFLKTFSDVRSRMNAIGDEIAAEVKAARAAADAECRKILGLDSGEANPAESVPARIARECLQHYYLNYDDYDMIIFPIMYETEVGEPSLVDVFRVSPEDATALIDERATNCHKLAGTALAHFGAFLEKRWRENDILWGRLDGAERIICSVLPSDHPQKDKLIGEAQAAIVYETIKDMGVQERHDLLCEAAMRTGSGNAEPNLLVSLDARQNPGFIDNLKGKVIDPLKGQLDAKIDNAAVRQRYLDIFATNRNPDPQSTLKTAARATTIVGKMFEELSNDYAKSGQKFAAWITRAGLIFWGLVELAAPKSIWNLLFRYWLKLLYLVEVILIVGGTVLVLQRIQQFGLILFGLTLAVHFAVTVLNDWMNYRTRWWQIAKTIAFTVLIVIVVVGAFSTIGLAGHPSIWRRMQQVHGWFSRASALRKWSPTVLVSIFFLVSIRKDFRRARSR
ncbi:MAG TPA: patatin-like protein [Pyrinomonadaceae bacterium]|jgi:patatin-related protein|nr:patatin-like protein [Pyrinomonadaceae bacterium]